MFRREKLSRFTRETRLRDAAWHFDSEVRRPKLARTKGGKWVMGWVPLMWNYRGQIMKRYEKQSGRSCFGAQVTWIVSLKILMSCMSWPLLRQSLHVPSPVLASHRWEGASNSKGEEQHQHSSCCWDSADENLKCWRRGALLVGLRMEKLVDGQGQRIINSNHSDVHWRVHQKHI